jgi:hypothetical protein
MEKNKRGISQVVATVLIIMLTVVAVSIIAGFVVPFVRNSLYGATECMPYKEFYTFDESFGLNCYQMNGESVIYAFSIKTSAKSELANNSDEFRIVLISESGETKPLRIGINQSASKGAGGIWILNSTSQNLRVPKPGGIITYGHQEPSTSRFESAEVYPVLKSGKICGDEKDSIALKSCENSALIN